MSVEGLWTTEFYGLYGWENRGVVVLEKGRVLGGGRNHFSVGKYELDGEGFYMILDIEYHGPAQTLLGSADKMMTIEFKGNLEDGHIEGSVSRRETPRQSLMFRLTKRADVP